MPTAFTLDQRLIGYAASTAAPGEKVPVRYRELIGPGDAFHLQRQLENFQNSLFCKIPGLPPPSLVDHLLVIIRPDLTCTAYCNELSIIAHARTTRTVEKGAPVYLSDLKDITSIDLGVEIPDDCGVMLVRSTGWKRSLFFDFGPLSPEVGNRTFPLEPIFAQQALLLLGLPSGIPQEAHPSESEPAEPAKTRLSSMGDGLAHLKSLLSSKCDEESQYQELLQQHPWMLGGLYSAVIRHQKLDDANIPDFTAVRCYDDCHDVIELKQPFLPLFKKGGGYTREFNESWDQAERYLLFATEQRNYLREAKDLRFETPRCLLICGHDLKQSELRTIRRKETFVRSISVLTYNHLVEIASNILSLMETAGKIAVTASDKSLANTALQLTSPSLPFGSRS